MDIVKTVTDWPVIAQGALGSGLFWALLTLGQRLSRRLAARVGADRKTANWFALAALEATGDARSTSRFLCLYAALHYLLKAAIVTVLSLALETVLSVFASVGYLMAAYYLFRGLAYVPHTASLGPAADRQREFQASLAAVGAKTVDSGPPSGAKPES